MRFKRPLTISAIAVAGVLALAACTDSGAPTTEETSSAPDEVIEFEAGTTMAALNEAGAITIGTKFDQPLFGRRKPGIAASLFFAEATPETLPHVKERDAEIEARKGALPHLVGNAEPAVGA